MLPEPSITSHTVGRMRIAPMSWRAHCPSRSLSPGVPAAALLTPINVELGPAPGAVSMIAPLPAEPAIETPNRALSLGRVGRDTAAASDADEQPNSQSAAAKNFHRLGESRDDLLREHFGVRNEL